MVTMMPVPTCMGSGSDWRPHRVIMLVLWTCMQSDILIRRLLDPEIGFQCLEVLCGLSCNICTTEHSPRKRHGRCKAFEGVFVQSPCEGLIGMRFLSCFIASGPLLGTLIFDRCRRLYAFQQPQGLGFSSSMQSLSLSFYLLRNVVSMANG